MRTDARRVLVTLLTFIVSLAALITASAQYPFKEFIVRCTPSQLDRIRSQHGAAIVDALPGSNLYLIAAQAAANSTDIQNSGTDVVASQNFSLSIADAFQATAGSQTFTGTAVDFYSAKVPSFYVHQPATDRTRVLDAHRYRTGARTVIAVIDTGVDENHPALKKNLLRGRNFVVPGASPSEWNDPVLSSGSGSGFALQDSYSTVFDLLDSYSTVFDLLDSYSTVFDLLQGPAGVIVPHNGTASFSPSQLPHDFGHGTMVAGVLHLVAPDAMIMPLKAFDANGNASLWDVARAIREAVDQGADVINLSFSATTDPEAAAFLQRVALDYASAANVAIVASAGNSNSNVLVPPASVTSVVAVAALNADDTKAAFSNYSRQIDISAPGTNMVTTYPGTYALVSGTSFSAPMVSGMFALMKEMGLSGSAAQAKIGNTSDRIDGVNPSFAGELGRGRINALRAVQGSY